jgi:hypothetical protein
MLVITGVVNRVPAVLVPEPPHPASMKLSRKQDVHRAIENLTVSVMTLLAMANSTLIREFR